MTRFVRATHGVWVATDAIITVRTTVNPNKQLWETRIRATGGNEYIVAQCPSRDRAYALTEALVTELTEGNRHRITVLDLA